jgi:glycosyltransferase involved in cell wall biosynthesis
MNNDSLQLISVLIPTYNCAGFIREAIDSVWVQDYDNLEIIIVDDGSTDDTKEIVERYVETRHVETRHAASLPTIKYFYKEHGGISETRNCCIEKASGEYLAFLDADDYWLPGKLHAQIEYLRKHPDCRIVFTRYTNLITDESLEKNRRVLFEKELEKMLKRYLPSALIHYKVFEAVGDFLTELTVGEDTEMISRIEFSGINTSHCLEEIYYHRRLHGKNTILSNRVSDKDLKKYLHRNFLKYKLQSKS